MKIGGRRAPAQHDGPKAEPRRHDPGRGAEESSDSPPRKGSRYHLRITISPSAPLAASEGDLEDQLETAFGVSTLAGVVLIAHQLLAYARVDACGPIEVDVAAGLFGVRIEVTYRPPPAVTPEVLNRTPAPELRALADEWGRASNGDFDILWAVVR
jgi:hypothetical protein